MPRPKVHETNRQRAIQACAPCKSSKRRCDCRQPCSNCIKRGDVVSCVFKEHLPRLPGNPKPKAAAAAAAAATSSNALKTTVVKSTSTSSRQSTDGPHTAPNMLWTSRGIQVYVGSSASLSFLVLLRDTLTRYAGSSTFTDASQSSVMLENRGPVATDDCCAECPRMLDDHTVLLDFYYAATSGVLDVLLDKAEVLMLLHTTDTLSDTPDIRSAVLHAVLAIGAQCSSSEMQDRQCERTHITKARAAAFKALRDDQLDVDLVRVFIILAFYMFGACRRNTAFMYIGIAARASDALGLHLQHERLQVWKSVRILDLLVAAVLGRSPATSDLPNSSVRSETRSQLAHHQQCLHASFDVWTTVDQIVTEFYRNGKSDTELAKGFLNKLSKWSADLPTSLKSNPPHGMARIQQQEYVIGNIHVSCAYYYAVVIATRKFLITVLHRALSKAADGSTVQQDTSEVGQLAQACIDSALLLLQTCKEVCEASMLLDNMCLLKAWIFAAGMIVGFAFFVDPDTYIGLQQALVDACQVLQHLAILSPQAKQYHDILHALHQAALEHHQRQHARSSEEQAPLVSKIFSYTQPSVDTDIFDGMSQSDNTMLSSSLQTDETFPIQMTLTPGDFSTECMDSVAAQFWDELLLDRERFQL